MDKNPKGRVILTYGRSLMALTAAHSLGKRGIEVIGCDDVDMTVMTFSKYVEDYFLYTPYQKNPEKFLDDLEKNIKKFKPDDGIPYVLMPMFRDAKLIAQNRDRFEPHIQIAVPEYHSIDQIHPKDVFANTCEEIGLRIPKTWHPQDMDSLQALKGELPFPVLIKPADDIGGRGIHKVKTFEELQSLCTESQSHYDRMPLIQELIEGEDYCLAAICDKGDIKAHMAYKNLCQFPRDSGAGIMRETIDDTPFLKTVEKLMKATNWHGVAQMDFRWNGMDNNQAYLIEVNPRFWAGLFHSVESGVDFPWLLYQLTVNGHITDIDEVKIGKKTKVPVLWTLPMIQDIADSEISFDALKKEWQAMWQKNNNQDWRDRFKNLGAALKSSFDGDDIVEKIKLMREMGKGATSEFEVEDDPFARLGFLFIVSALLRHKELPPELKM